MGGGGARGGGGAAGGGSTGCGVAGGGTKPYTFLTIQPTFTVKDWAAAEPIMADFVERTEKETACVYYGWSKCGDKLFCREAYVDAAGVLAHLENVGPCVDEILKLSGLEDTGPAAEKRMSRRSGGNPI